MRPALHAAPSTAGLRVAVEAAEAIDAAAWDDLFRRAQPPHPHYSRHVIAAHRAAGLPPPAGVVTVRLGERLEGLLPYRIRPDAAGFGGRLAQPFRSPFVTATAPLLARADGAVADALVTGLAAASRGRGWRWPLLTVDEEAARALRAALARAGWTVAEVEGFARPVLVRAASLSAYAAGHPHRRKLRDLERRQRRLAEAGTLALETATEGPELARAVEAFLALERAGWKGQAATAMACRPETAAFARALFRPSGGPVAPRADSLLLDGRPIAISLGLVAAGTATMLKIAYDETRRAQAPGLVLEAAIMRACHETGFAARLDSAAMPGTPLDDLYRERQRVAEILALPPGQGALGPRLSLARLEHAARRAVRHWLGR